MSKQRKGSTQMSQPITDLQIKQQALEEMSPIHDRSVQIAYLFAELRLLNHKLERLIELQSSTNRGTR